MNRHIRIKITEEDYLAVCKVIDLLQLGESIGFPLDRWGHFDSEYATQRPEIIAALKLPPIEETGWPAIFARTRSSAPPEVKEAQAADAVATRGALLEFEDTPVAQVTKPVIKKDKRPLSILDSADVAILNGYGIHVDIYYRGLFGGPRGGWRLVISNPEGAYLMYSEGYMMLHRKYPISRDRVEIKRQLWEAHLRAERDAPRDAARRAKAEAVAKRRVDEWEAQWRGSG